MAILSMGIMQGKAKLDFVHKYNSSYNCSVKVDDLKFMAGMMPSSLKREIGLDYYPQILEGLRNSSDVTVKDVTAHIDYLESGLIQITLSLPKATLYIRDATWEEMDDFSRKFKK